MGVIECRGDRATPEPLREPTRRQNGKKAFGHLCRKSILVGAKSTNRTEPGPEAHEREEPDTPRVWSPVARWKFSGTRRPVAIEQSLKR